MNPRSLVVAMCLAGSGCDAVFGSKFPHDAGSALDDGSRDGTIEEAELEECHPSTTMLEPLPTIGAVATYFVDGSVTLDEPTCGPAGMACKTIPYMLARAAAMHPAGLEGVVIHVRGNIEYPTSDAEAAITLTSVHRGLVLRAEENTGVPVIQAANVARIGVHVCCSDSTNLVDNIVIAGFEITNAKEQGILVEGMQTSSITLRDNLVRVNGVVPTALSAGILLANEAHDIVIANNSIATNENMSGDPDLRASGLRIAASSENVVFGNLFLANGGDGIRIRGARNRLDDNRIVNSGVSGIDLGGVDNKLCNNVTAGSAVDGVVIGGETANVVHHTSAHSGNHGVSIRAGTTATLKNVIVAYNSACGINRDTPAAEPIDHHNLYFANQAARCATSPNDPASDVMDNPRFTDHESSDYTLAAESAAHGRGESGTTIGALRSATRPR